MRKWLYIVSAVVLLGLLSAAYYITGVRAEKEFNRFLESSENLPNATITADHYHRGWLKSSVHINAVVHQPEQAYEQDGVEKIFPAQDVTFSFTTDIYHGPIIVANHHILLGLGYAHAAIPLPNEALSQFNQVFTQDSVKPIFEVSLLLKYRNSLNVGFDIPPFMLTSKDGVAQLQWKGFFSQWKLSNKLSRTKGSIDFDGATFKNQNSNGEMGPLKLRYDVENTDSQILTGDATLNLQNMQFVLNDDKPIVVEGFQAVTANHVDKNLVNSSLKADVSKVTFNGLEYGPGVLSLEIRNLDSVALNQVQEQLQTASNEDLTEAQQQVLLLGILPELPVLLGKGAEFELKQFQLSIPQGLILATAKVKLPVQKDTKQSPLFLLNQLQARVNIEAPVLWLDNVAVDFLRFKMQQHQLMEKEEAAENDTDVSSTEKTDTAIAPVKLLSDQEIEALAKQEAAGQLAQLVENNVLIKKDNIYSVQITFKEGVLLINGKPFNGNMLQ